MTLGLLAALQVAVLAAGERVVLQAEEATNQGDRSFLSGRASLRAEGVVVRADEVVYDQALGVATARGNVRFVSTLEGVQVGLADAALVTLAEDQLESITLLHGRLWEKTAVDPDQLLEEEDASGLISAGRALFYMEAEELARRGPSRWEVTEARFTPCDCDLSRPSWHIGALSALIDLRRQRASVLLPTFHVPVFGARVPVFALPWLELPLSRRATGLLFPKLKLADPFNQVVVALPVFVTLGESADVTLTPHAYSLFGSNLRAEGVFGPGLDAELRYALAEPREAQGAGGEARLSFVYDLKPPVYAFTGRTVPAALEPGVRGPRYEVIIRHRHELSRRWFGFVDLDLYSDANLFRDRTSDVLLRGTAYQTSSAALYHRGDELYAGLDVQLLQDLRYGTPLFGPPLVEPADSSNPQSPGGEYARRSPNTLMRWPALQLVLPERPLGPALVSLFSEYTRHSPLDGRSGDEGASADEGRPFDPATGRGSSLAELAGRLYCPTPSGCPPDPPDDGEADGMYQLGEREPRQRVVLRPRLSVPWTIADGLTLTPYAGYHQAVTLGELSGRASARGYALVGASAESELSRAFVLDDTLGEERWLHHAWLPSLAVHAVPFVVGPAPSPYDPLDTGVAERLAQAQASLGTTLALGTAAGRAGQLRLDVGQSFDLLRADERTSSEVFGRMGLELPPFCAVNADARYDPLAERMSTLSVGAQLSAGAGGPALSMTYEVIAASGSDRMRAGLDELFSPRPAGRDVPGLTPAARYALPDAALLTFAASVPLASGLDLRYGLLAQRRGAPVRSLGDPGPAADLPLPLATVDQALNVQLVQQTLALEIHPACAGCWQARVTLQHTPVRDLWFPPPLINFDITVERVGSFGS